MTRRPRGMTLLECLFSLALFGVIVTMMASLMHLVLNSQRLKGSRHRVGEVAISLLYQMGHEANTANQWHSPAAGGMATELDFESPDWEDQGVVLPNPLPSATPSPTPGLWQPIEPAHQMHIRYFLDGESLKRRLSADGSSWTTTLLTSVRGFRTGRPGQRLLSLELVIREDGEDRTYRVDSLLSPSLWEPQP